MIPMHNQPRYLMICLLLYILGFPLMYLLFQTMDFFRGIVMVITIEIFLWLIITSIFYMRTAAIFTKFHEVLYRECDIPKAKRILENAKKHHQSDMFKTYLHILFANAYVLDMDYDKVQECMQTIQGENLHGMMKILYHHNTCVYAYRMNDYEKAHDLFLAIEQPISKKRSMQMSFYQIQYEQLQSIDAYHQQKITRQAYMKRLYDAYLEAPNRGTRVMKLYELYQLHVLSEVQQQAIANYILQQGNTYACVKQIIDSRGESYE